MTKQSKTQPRTVAQKLIEAHLVSGKMKPGEEIGLRIDQTLTQDATGTLVMLELEAMGLDQAKTELSAQYVDHNLLQVDSRNPDDHLFLKSACEKFGIWFSPPGSGVSHAVHMERFGKPGKTLLGSDSHTCAAGSMGMLAMGAGGLAVAMAICGEPFYLNMPKVMGVKLTGKLPDWVSAKDVVLEMLRRHDVKGGAGKIIEYYGPGLKHLSAMDRHVIANMGQEMGHTATVFPADDAVRDFLKQQHRKDDFERLEADEGATYDEHEEIDLSKLEPLIALPSSPGKVVPVREVAGEPIYQAYIGSSANPGLRDFVVPAMMVKDRQVHEGVSFDINPTSRQVLENLSKSGYLMDLLSAGARLHQTGCNGCIGMGQAPATDQISLRTVPRNFPGRSGTEEDKVCLCSPETATASALTGVITDPRDLDMAYPAFNERKTFYVEDRNILPPAKHPELSVVQKGPNISTLPLFDGLPDELTAPVLLKVGDNISTDEILPAGSKILPFRSNIPAISEFTYTRVDASYPERAKKYQEQGSVIVGGDNYGQGSSREHAALAPRYLGVRVVVAKSYSRIHWQNLCNFGILPLRFAKADDLDRIEQGDELTFADLAQTLVSGGKITAKSNRGGAFEFTHDLSERQIKMILKGGLLNMMRESLAA
ncbi:aconitate hydratase [Marinobacter nanhaiticus D15-8W]|uniref:Aconitate hydratase n=1 Tax=Marinobacter nanhaiticus D15-8W TaxID=626887 RepID=N6WPE0_9GAMM|nr:aconitate hydratase [Marinobacter nanhaiticus]ENO12937.1 aconitate hydratase [Marinobacter nanhaiticus D15-8W]BES70289.1 aconitate hydratase [Marinobacter nanhaiticus D15-8W]